MMRRAARLYRQCATGFCFAVFGLMGILAGLTLFPLLCLSAPDAAAAKRRAQYFTHRWFRIFADLMRALGLISYEVQGAEKLARRGQLIVANHPTLIDVVLLIGHIPQVDCILKAALFRNPFTRLPARWSGYISNSEPEQLLRDCAATLRQGNSLLIFPEGTRSRPGQPIHVPHGTARIALEGGVPVLPVIISCEPITLTKGRPFWDVPPRRAQFRIEVGEPYSAQKFLDGAPSLAIAARRLSRHWEQEFSLHTGRALEHAPA